VPFARVVTKYCTQLVSPVANFLPLWSPKFPYKIVTPFKRYRSLSLHTRVKDSFEFRGQHFQGQCPWSSRPRPKADRFEAKAKARATTFCHVAVLEVERSHRGPILVCREPQRAWGNILAGPPNTFTGPLWGANFWMFLFKMVHSGVLYIYFYLFSQLPYPTLSTGLPTGTLTWCE